MVGWVIFLPERLRLFTCFKRKKNKQIGQMYTWNRKFRLNMSFWVYPPFMFISPSSPPALHSEPEFILWSAVEFFMWRASLNLKQVLAELDYAQPKMGLWFSQPIWIWNFSMEGGKVWFATQNNDYFSPLLSWIQRRMDSPIAHSCM